MASPISNSRSSRGASSSDESSPASPHGLVMAELAARLAGRSPSSTSPSPPARSFRALTVSPTSPRGAERKEDLRPRAQTSTQELSWAEVYQSEALANPPIFLNILKYAKTPILFPKGYQEQALRDVADQFKAIMRLQNEEDRNTAVNRSLNEATLRRIGITVPRLQEILNQLAALPKLDQ